MNAAPTAAIDAAAAGGAATAVKEEELPSFWQKWKNYIFWGAVIAVVAAVVIGVVFLIEHVGTGDHGRAVGGATLAEGATALSPTPKGDRRTYQHKTLDNGIQVVTIADPSALSSAYSVAVLAGSFDDPPKLPGLAHFCEHMVFLGSKSYPDPKGYDGFVNQNNGAANAYTADEVTVYFTEISNTAFREGLGRFAEFFYAPLFQSEYVEKEVQAIDSEHAKNVQDPQWRLQSLMQSLASPKSPVSSFHTGDRQTLYDEPKKLGLDPVGELKSWFQDHYCPAKMRLVTYGPTSLVDQMKFAEEAFAAAPPGSKTCQGPRKSWASPQAWPNSSTGKYVTVLGTQPQAELLMQFSLPDLRPHFRSNPVEYINYALVHSSPDSLFVVLRDSLGLATSLELSVDSNSAGSQVHLEIGLTQMGREHPNVVLGTVFQYLTTLRSKGVDTALYSSLENVTLLQWDWAELSKPSDAVSEMAERMTRLPTADLLTGDALIEKQDAQLVASILSMLTPERVNVAFVVPDSEADALKSAPGQLHQLPHYGIKHKIAALAEAFPDDTPQWSSWLAGPALDPQKAAEQLKSRIRLAGIQYSSNAIPVPPKAIVDIPADFDTLHMRADAPPGRTGFAEKLFGQAPALLQIDGQVLEEGRMVRGTLSKVELWYRSGWMTNSPSALLKVALRIKKPKDAPEASAVDANRLALWSSLFGQEVTPKLADLSAAGASFSVNVQLEGVQFAFSGLPPLIPRVVDAVLAEFNRGVNITDRARYDHLYRQFEESYADYSDMPVQYALQDRNMLLSPGGHSSEEGLAALKQVTTSNVASALSKLVTSKPLEVTAFGIGNIGDSELKRTVDVVSKSFGGFSSSSAGNVGEVERVARVVKPAQPIELRKKNPRPGDGNDVVVVSMLIGVATVENRVLNGLLGQILSSLAYEELRTEQQLGYVVSAGSSALSNVRYMSTVVQGNKLGADEVEAAVEQVHFVTMPAHLRNMTDSAFQKYKASFEELILQPPTGHSEEADHFWPTIMHGGTCFNLQDQLLKFLRTSVSSKDMLVQAWDELIRPEGGWRNKVVVKFFAKDVPQRPAKEAAMKLWKEKGVTEDGIALLSSEFDKTLVLDKADSESRAKLLKIGGSLYPTDMNCQLVESPAPKKHAAQARHTRALEAAVAEAADEAAPLGADFVETPTMTALVQLHDSAAAGGPSRRLAGRRGESGEGRDASSFLRRE